MRELYICLCLFFIACNRSDKINDDKRTITHDMPSDTFNMEKRIIDIEDTCELEKRIIASGLINIQLLDSSIAVYLKYSDTANFMHEDVYGDLNRLYLQPDVAKKLVNAQAYLKQEYPYYSLLVLDGVRPLSVQQKMWDVLDMPASEKGKFVSNPKNKSLHNFGAAVDITIIDSLGKELDMGTPYDFAGELAYPSKEEQMVKEGRLTKQQVNNRKILRKVMYKAGFWGIQTEWWHFNACTRQTALQIYRVIE